MIERVEAMPTPDPKFDIWIFLSYFVNPAVLQLDQELERLNASSKLPAREYRVVFEQLT